MTDAFALLDQPRRPWLAPDALKQAFHTKALQAHPDAHEADASGAAFAQLNEAHQVLQDPKRRLQHLLTLVGHPPDRRATSTPKAIEELFPVVAAVTQQMTAVMQQSTAATTALSRSLLKPKLLQASSELNAASDKLAALQQNAAARVRELDERWDESSGDQLAELHDIYLQFSYVTRWREELDEKRMQLSAC
jgi:curved DNA-binding protein CbpA